METYTPSALERLAEAALAVCPYAGCFELGAGSAVNRYDAPTTVGHCVEGPIAFIVLQGAKRSIWGAQEFSYGAGDLVVTGIDLPNEGRVLEASPEKPALFLSLGIDKALIAELLRETPPTRDEPPSCKNGMAVMKADEGVIDAYRRLFALTSSAASPLDAALVPLVVREIHCRLLFGQAGGILRAVNTPGFQSQKIARAVDWLRDHYAEPLNIETLAGQVGMSASAFYRHFKELAMISPLQYQKQLRLMEARRLMIIGQTDAASACFAVGYESIPQFTREYKRLFGDPPARNTRAILSRG
jgi:AraC-like DNA-binding protein